MNQHNAPKPAQFETQNKADLRLLIDAVKAAIREQGWSQKRAAEISGSTESQISRICNNGPVSEEGLLRVAIGLDGGIKALANRLRSKIPKSDSVPVSVPPSELLLNAFRAFDSAFEDALNSGKTTQIAHAARSFFHADACALFLVTNIPRNRLLLASSSNERVPPDYNSGRLFSMQSREGTGLTSHIVHAWQNGDMDVEPKVWSLDDLKVNLYISSGYQEHLSEGKAFCRLHIPLTRLDGRLLGVLSLTNKVGPNGDLLENVCFDELDRANAIAVGRLVSHMVQVLMRLSIYSDIMSEMQLDHDRDRYLHRFLESIVNLVQADRGDIALIEKDLVVRAVAGEHTNNTVKTNFALPRKSFISALWRSEKQYRIARDIRTETDYLESDSRTRSALAVKLELNGHPIGVLNVESFRENAFTEADQSMLFHFTKYFSSAMQVLGEEPAIAGAIEEVLGSRNFTESLKGILQKVNDIYAIDRGMIYIADDKQKQLFCRACNGYDAKFEQEALKFAHPYDRKSVATRIYKSGRPFFTTDAKLDSHVNQEGVNFFKIEGSLIGVPLQVSGRVLGVLVAWRHEGAKPSKAHLFRLQVFAKLAALAIEIWRWRERLSKVLEIEQKVADALPIQIFRKDLKGRFTFGNRAFCLSLQEEWENIRGKTDSDFYPAELAVKFCEDDHSVTANEIIWETEEFNRPRKQETAQKVKVVKVPIYESGQLCGVQVIFWPVSLIHAEGSSEGGHAPASLSKSKD